MLQVAESERFVDVVPTQVRAALPDEGVYLCTVIDICPCCIAWWTIHSDNGAFMASHLVASLLADLGVTDTRTRPHVSNDDPCSESASKTLKHRPDVPNRSG